MTKAQFLALLEKEAQAWFSNRDRAVSAWWLALEDLSKDKYSRANFEERKEKQL